MEHWNDERANPAPIGSGESQSGSSRYLDPLADESDSIRENFASWYAQAKVPQIRYIALLTALLYILFGLVEWRIAPDIVREQSVMLRGFLVPALLCSIALLSYRSRLHGCMRALLSVAPVCAVAINLYLNTVYNQFNAYTPELYLALIWLFTVSGMTLRQASYTALVMISLILLYTFNAGLPTETMLLHFLWIISSLSFGLLTAFTIEKTYKLTYLQQRELEHTAATDSLTTLWNRAKTEELLDNEIKRSDRYGKPFCVILLDIDHFKSVNDTYGHSVGDQLLKEFAELLNRNIRKVDHAGRWGGEEFLIVLPETGVRQAETVAQSLRAHINGFHFTRLGPKTASFGVTEHRPGESASTLINRVDQALYKAKADGRDCSRTL